MKVSKVMAIAMGMIASCLLGSYVTEASTVTLDDSVTGTPENPQPISATKSKKTATTETSIKTSPTGVKNTAIRSRSRKLAVTPEKDVSAKTISNAVSTTAPAENNKNIENQTETTSTTRIFVKSISTSSETRREIKKEIKSVPQREEIVTMPVVTTEPVKETTEATEQVTEPVTEQTEPIIEQTEPVAEQTEPVIEQTEPVSEKTTTEQPVQTTLPATTASARITMPEIVTKARPKATTTAETTSRKKATTTSTTTTTQETTTTTTTTTSTTTTTTTTTSEETTTTTTTTPEPIITTIETTVIIPVVQDSEIIDVSEIYLDDIFNSNLEEMSMTVEEIPETIPEETMPELSFEDMPEIILEQIPEIIAELDDDETIIAIVDTSKSVSDSDYILLCNAVAHEAGSDSISIENKAKVVEVIMNRVDSSSFPNTVYGVITQKSQFSGSSSYADLGTYSSKVTQNVKSAVDLYFSDPSAYSHGYLYFYGDGSQNHFSVN
ncbi:MAG: cell wall hydrolase [Oscillospiraceae bacterium]|nr:cell wall hydrolase [Oscillospiraceae bacterium]